MIYNYLIFSIAIAFISFMVGMIINAFLKNTSFYTNNLSNLNFIRSERINLRMGVGVVKWMVLNTPFKFFNQKFKLRKKLEKTDLLALRKDMTSSEIDHLIGFVFVTGFALEKFYKAEYLFGLTIMIVNMFMNLYPSLLQQQNKRRMDRLMKRM